MIYLDNCATTKPRDEVVEAMLKALRDDYGNPSSLHRMGLNAEKLLKEARKTIANYLGVSDGEIYFTSGGTESNNIAIQGTVKANSRIKGHIITSSIEHPAVRDTIIEFEKMGHPVTWLKVDKDGRIDLDELRDNIREDTVLLSLILVNNEIGTIQDIHGINRILSSLDRKPHFHVDGVQSFGKISFMPKNFGIDSYAFSGHKIYGPKGIGGLYLSSEKRLAPIVFGGGQEKGLRSGTENMTGIVGMAEAVKQIQNNFNAENEKISSIKSFMIAELLKLIPDLRINSPTSEIFSPYILNISIPGTKGEVIVHMLEENGIFVSTTSACSSKGSTRSHVLSAIGLSDELIEGTIRISFSKDNSETDILFVSEKIREASEEIRSITGR